MILTAADSFGDDMLGSDYVAVAGTDRLAGTPADSARNRSHALTPDAWSPSRGPVAKQSAVTWPAGQHQSDNFAAAVVATIVGAVNRSAVRVRLHSGQRAVFWPGTITSMPT